MRERGWELAAHDMLEACERCLEYTAGLDQAAFISDRRTYDATIRNIEIVGEAANNVPRAIQDAYPGIPWRGIVDTRNRIIHGYGMIDDDTVWEIVTRDIPDLIPQLRDLLQQAERQD